MIVVLDPGHGGTDPGAIGTFPLYGVSTQVMERSMTLDFALAARNYLQSYKGYTVIMTRDTNKTIYPNERAAIADNNGANAFLSIHFNSGSSTAQGTETFYNVNRTGDRSFAQAIQDGVLGTMGTVNRGIKPDTQSALGRLGVLWGSGSYPRALVEVEFISNPTAMANIGYEFYERSLDFASGVVNGFGSYFG